MQVAIDSEVLAGYAFKRDLAFHKILHTFAGATTVAALTLLLLRPALGRGMRWWNRSGNTEPGSVWHMEPQPSPMATVLSVFRRRMGPRTAGRPDALTHGTDSRQLHREIRSAEWSLNTR